MLSFDKGDLKTPEFRALNPRGRVPVIVDDGFALFESAAIVEFLEDKQPGEARLFSANLRSARCNVEGCARRTSMSPSFWSGW